MVNAILAAAMRVALEKAQLAQQASVVGDRDETARPQGQALEIELRLWPFALHVMNSAAAPSSSNPFLRIGIAIHRADAVTLQQLCEILCDLFRIEGRRYASADIDNEA